jgi:DegV family protein with EDD domain
MKKVAVVTDTTACVPQAYVNKLEIELVPVQLFIDGKSYRDGIDISPSDFYTLMRKVPPSPATSSSSPGPYLNAFCHASEKASGIFCLTEPSRFSAMYSSALVAKDTAVNTLKNVTVEVVECATAAAGQGLVVLAAAQAAYRNKPLVEVRQIAEDVMSRVNLFAALDTLQYLARSGRVPQTAAIVNSVLSIKPVFTLNHAGARTVALPRTMRSAMDRMLKLMEDKVAGNQKLHVAVMHADARDQAETFKDRITSRFDCLDIFITEFTPVMGVHTGPGLIGVAFYCEKPETLKYNDTLELG